jgi:plastocyanin
MSARRRLATVAVGVLGVAAGALPAIAGSQTTPTIEPVSVGKGIYGEEFRWSPSSAAVGVGASVALANPSEVKHGIYWSGGPAAPSCSAGVPVGTGPAASGTNWSGSCTFPVAGVYTFYCTVHGPAMSAQVSVSASGTTTVTTTTGTQPSPVPTGTAPSPGPGIEGGAGSPSGAGPASLLTAAPAQAIKLSSVSHGRFIRGRIALSSAAHGGRLEVRALIRRGGRSVRAATLVRAGLPGGPLTFELALSHAALRPLRGGHRLSVTVELTLRASSGASLRVSRRLLVHR